MQQTCLKSTPHDPLVDTEQSVSVSGGALHETKTLGSHIIVIARRLFLSAFLRPQYSTRHFYRLVKAPVLRTQLMQLEGCKSGRASFFFSFSVWATYLGQVVVVVSPLCARRGSEARLHCALCSPSPDTRGLRTRSRRRAAEPQPPARRTRRL